MIHLLIRAMDHLLAWIFIIEKGRGWFRVIDFFRVINYFHFVPQKIVLRSSVWKQLTEKCWFSEKRWLPERFDFPKISTDPWKVNGEWEDKHSIILDNYNGTYKIWHLEPDTLYEIALRLSRPGQGGTGELGPLLQVRTRCNIPSELDNITADPIKGDLTFCSLYTLFRRSGVFRAHFCFARGIP